MEIINREIESYIDNHTHSLSEILDELEELTNREVPMPNMISGKVQGNFLYLFISALNPQKVIELGTYTGYATICIGMGMSEESSLVSIDTNESIAPISRKYIQKAGLEHRVTLIQGEAMKYLETLEDGSIDCIFIDADKSNYPHYVDLGYQKLRNKGYLIVDNVLWHGKILDTNPDNRTKAILKCNNLLSDKKKWTSVINPLRDGITIAMKN